MLFSFRIKYITIAALFWLTGCLAAIFLLSRFSYASTYNVSGKFSLSPVSIIHTKNVFTFILSNNCVVALLLAITGFFTGGLLTAMLNIWNGIFFGLLMLVTMHYTPDKLWVALLYGPFELPAFFLFSAFGFEGFFYLRKIVLNKPVYLYSKNLKLKRLWLPAALLFMAAIIEAITIKYS